MLVCVISSLPWNPHKYLNETNSEKRSYMLNYQEKMRCLPELRKSNDEFMMNCGMFYN
jgi:hypothetical protein